MTNRCFLKALLQQPELQKSAVSTKFVENLISQKKSIINRENWEIALLAAAVENYADRYIEDFQNFRQQFNRAGSPKNLTIAQGYELTITHNNAQYNFLIRYMGFDFFYAQVNNQLIIFKYEWRDKSAALTLNDVTFEISYITRGNTRIFEINKTPYPINFENKGVIKAPSPSIILNIAVKKGQTVKKGDYLISLEAMKMETIITAEDDGIITEVCICEGEQVSAGQTLLKIECSQRQETDALNSLKNDNAESLNNSIDFSKIAFDANDISKNNIPKIWDYLCSQFRAYFLGFDINAPLNDIFKDITNFAELHPNFYEMLLNNFLDVIEIYCDIEILFSSQKFETENAARQLSFQELLMHYFKRIKEPEKGLPEIFLNLLNKASRWYSSSRIHEIEAYLRAVFRFYKTHANISKKNQLLLLILRYIEENFQKFNIKSVEERLSQLLISLAQLTELEYPNIAFAADNLKYKIVNQFYFSKIKDIRSELLKNILVNISNKIDIEEKLNLLNKNICDYGSYIINYLLQIYINNNINDYNIKTICFDLLARRLNRDREYLQGELLKFANIQMYKVITKYKETENITILSVAKYSDIAQHLVKLNRYARSYSQLEIILFIHDLNDMKSEEDYNAIFNELKKIQANIKWLSLNLYFSNNTIKSYFFQHNELNELIEIKSYRDFNVSQIREFRLSKFRNFNIEIINAQETVYLTRCISLKNPKDERAVLFIEIPEFKPDFNDDGSIKKIAVFENIFYQGIYLLRNWLINSKQRTYWNQIIISLYPLLNTSVKNIEKYSSNFVKAVAALELEKITIIARAPRERTSDNLAAELEYVFENITKTQFSFKIRYPEETIIQTIDDYALKVITARRRNCIYPYEFIKMITRASGYVTALTDKFPQGNFEEYDIDETGKPVSVKNRMFGENKSNIIFGVITHYFTAFDEPIDRIIILSDPTQNMCSLAEPECRRIIAAIDLADALKLPIEWIATSSGARIDMNSGTENLDWTAAVLRRIIEFTQNHGEINIIVQNVNVGAQSYWNAEATMLMHTKGILIMIEDSAMLLTGKKALDYSGSVSAENNVGIGGFEKIMGPNGEAQFFAKDIYSAYHLLLKHYELLYAPANANQPLFKRTIDSDDRNICLTKYNDITNQNFNEIGDILGVDKNADRKKTFDIRQVMQSLIDSDSFYLERWQAMKDAETAIVWETRIGGYGVGLLGIESRPLTRLGETPNDGPEIWTGGTLFPLSSKKMARAINAFSNKAPIVILANLSGFDGSPESLRRCQLEFGAEIGRAIVNFKGKIVFVVIARYHGGAYVVFSKRLNENLTAVAITGAFASVIGGASAAAVVFTKKVKQAVEDDNRIIEARALLKQSKLKQSEFEKLYNNILTEKQIEFAQKFDKIHSVERALSVKSIDEIIMPENLRPFIISKLKG